MTDDAVTLWKTFTDARDKLPPEQKVILFHVMRGTFDREHDMIQVALVKSFQQITSQKEMGKAQTDMIGKLLVENAQLKAELVTQKEPVTEKKKEPVAEKKKQRCDFMPRSHRLGFCSRWRICSQRESDRCTRCFVGYCPGCLPEKGRDCPGRRSAAAESP